MGGLLYGTRRALVGTRIRYLLHDEFRDARAAGTINNTYAIPGPGTRVVTDTGNNLALTGGRAVASGIVGAADPRLGYTDAIPRVAGRTLKYVSRWVSTRGGGGWATTTTPAAPTLGIWEASGVVGVIPPVSTGYQSCAAGFDYTIWATLFAVGGAVWIQGGGGTHTYANPTLLWVAHEGTTDPMYVFPIIARAVACDIQVDNVEVLDRPVLGSAELLATVYQSTPATGVGYVSSADAIHYAAFTLPGVPAAGNDLGIHYRKSDAANYWHAYIERNGGNTNYDFYLDRVVAGVPNNHVTVANVGNTTAVAIVVHGDDHYCFSRVGVGPWVKRGATITNAFNNTETETAASFDAGTTTLLESYARTWTL